MHTSMAVRLSPVILAVLLCACAQPAAAQALPGGASQLQETHGDWRVACGQQNGQKQCAFSQQQTDKESRQLVLGIELKTAGDRVEGVLILPFGLAVDKPVSLQIDEGPSQTARFNTCLPAGCLVPVVFDPATVASLKKGTTLKVKAVAVNGQDTAFTISLKGFASALDRTAALVK